MSQAPLPDPHDIIVGKSAAPSTNGKAVSTGAKANGTSTRSRRAL